APIVVTHMQASGPTVVQVNAPPNFNASSTVPVWAVGMKGFAILGLLLFLFVVRRVASPRAGHGYWLAWPGIIVAGFLGFIFFVRITASYDKARIDANSARETAQAMAARQE